MSHALYRFCRWVCVCSVVAFAIGRLNATGTWSIDVLNSGSTPVDVVSAVYVSDATTPAVKTTVTIPPGAIHNFNGSNTSESSYSVMLYRPGVMGTKVGNSYMFDSDAGDSPLPDGSRVFMIVNQAIAAGTANFIRSFDSAEPPFGYTVEGSSRSEVPDAAKSVWRVDDETLTPSVFREGVDKIVYQVGSMTGGGSSSTPGRNATGDSVEDMAKIAKDLMGPDDDTETLSTGEGRPHMRVPRHAASDAEAYGATVAGTIRDQIQTAAGGAAPTELGYDVDTGSPPDLFTLHMPAIMSGKTWHLNPFTSDKFQGVAHWFRQAVAWLTLIVLASWVWTNVQNMLIVTAAAPQAKGNTVAGSGGQITAFFAAIAITTAIVVFITALLSWSFGEITFSALSSLATQNPMTSLASGSAYMLTELLPVATIISALVARVTFRFYSVPLLTFCLTVVRFVVV